MCNTRYVGNYRLSKLCHVFKFSCKQLEMYLMRQDALLAPVHQTKVSLLVSNLCSFSVNSLLLRFTDDTFDPDQAATIGG